MIKVSGTAPEQLPIVQDLKEVKGAIEKAQRDMRRLDKPKRP